MYFIPMGLLREARPDAFWPHHRAAGRLPEPDVGAFLFANLLPVTIGNIIGGALLVGAVYWFVYLRGREDADQSGQVARTAVGGPGQSR